jgi:hypothetical protein
MGPSRSHSLPDLYQVDTEFRWHTQTSALNPNMQILSSSSQFCFIFLLESEFIILTSLRIMVQAINMNKTVHIQINARTSRSRYWYQARSSTAGCKCGAPLCLMTYSVQKMAVSKADIGLSR